MRIHAFYRDLTTAGREAAIAGHESGSVAQLRTFRLALNESDATAPMCKSAVSLDLLCYKPRS